MSAHRVMSFKAAIKDFAAAENIPAQVALQNFMFERFFARLSKSAVKDKFVLKGGVLVSQYLGLDRRTTMDVDMTMRNATLDESSLRDMLEQVFSAPIDDGIEWRIKSVEPIRENDAYGGLRAKVVANMETITVPFSIDVSTGDAITPGAVEFFIRSRFLRNEFYRVQSYTPETVLAEKMEAILTRGVLSTRPRDYYDFYMVWKQTEIDKSVFRDALAATMRHRGTFDVLAKAESVIASIRASTAMQRQWDKFQREFPFANGIGFGEILDTLNGSLRN